MHVWRTTTTTIANAFPLIYQPASFLLPPPQVWPVYRSFKRQEGRDILGFLRQGSVTFAELPTFQSITRAAPLSIHYGAFTVQVVPDAKEQLKEAYGKDCFTTVKVWNNGKLTQPASRCDPT